MNGQTSATKPAGMAIHNGIQSEKTLRMGRSLKAGQGLSRYFVPVNPPHDWPGRAQGIRKPNPAETPLSWHEVEHFLSFAS